MSMNLALGSALASIGLTIPAVAVVSLVTGWTLTLGLDIKSSVLLLLSLLVAHAFTGNRTHDRIAKARSISSSAQSIFSRPSCREWQSARVESD
jgi:hypothetical protein